MLSGLVALVVAKLESSLMMTSSVHSMSPGHSFGETVIISQTVREATEVLKFLPKGLLRDLRLFGVSMLSHRLFA